MDPQYLQQLTDVIKQILQIHAQGEDLTLIGLHFST